MARKSRKRSTLARRIDFVVHRLPRWLRPAETTLARRFGLATREDRLFFLLIVLVGLTAGVLGSVVHRLIDGLQHLLWRTSGSVLETVRGMEPPWVVGTMAVGGLGVGLLLLLLRSIPLHRRRRCLLWWSLSLRLDLV